LPKFKLDKITNVLLLCLAFSVPVFGRSPNIIKYLLILIVTAWLVRRKINFKNSLSFPIALYVLIVLISAFTGINVSESIRYFAKHTVNIIMVFVVSGWVKERYELEKLIKLFLLSAGIVCALGILQYLSKRFLFLSEPLSWIGLNPPGENWRITSTRRHPLVFANNIALYLPLMTAYTMYSRKISHVMVLITMTAALLLTYSRMPFAAVMLAAAVVLFINFSKFKRIFLIGIATIAVTTLIIFSISGKSLKTRLNLNLASRDYVWKDSARLVKKYTIFGVGQGNVADSFVAPKWWHLSHTHNTYLQVLVASGVFALITFFWIVYAFFKEMFRRIKHPDVGKFEKYILVGLLFGFAAEGMCGLTDDLFCRAEIYYPIYFLAGLAMSRALDPSNRLKDGAKE